MFIYTASTSRLGLKKKTASRVGGLCRFLHVSACRWPGIVRTDRYFISFVCALNIPKSVDPWQIYGIEKKPPCTLARLHAEYYSIICFCFVYMVHVNSAAYSGRTALPLHTFARWGRRKSRDTKKRVKRVRRLLWYCTSRQIGAYST
jgi:hypothetical protein